MRNEDNDCIRYLMKEMDPSEELLMERAMMEDEDLLIEVESMRQTLQKLDQLPEMDPPSDVTDAVMEKAAEQAKENRNDNYAYNPAIKYAVAATLALTITAGGAWLFVGSEGSEQRQASVASSSSEQTEQAEMPQAAGAQMATDQGFQEAGVRSASTTSSQPTVEPWVDRNDILRFEEQFSSSNDKFEAILQQSTQKLQLIENSTINGGRVNSFQLTGSGN